MITTFENLAAVAIALKLTFVWNAMSDSDKLEIFMLFTMALASLVILDLIQPLISNLVDWMRKDYQAFINFGPGLWRRTLTSTYNNWFLPQLVQRCSLRYALCTLREYFDTTLPIRAILVGVAMGLLEWVSRHAAAQAVKWHWLLRGMGTTFGRYRIQFFDLLDVICWYGVGHERTLWLEMLGIFRPKSAFEPPQVSSTVKPSAGKLSSLPQRDGPHPTTCCTTSQRQLDQKAAFAFGTLSEMLADIAAEYPTRLRVGTSLFDKNNIALFVNPERGEVMPRHAAFEIAHIHRIDGSMHLIMHPADIKVVVENKWGEEHPMAKADCWWLWLFVRLWGTRPLMPEELVLIYSPRNEEEVEAVRTLVEAARTLVEAAASWIAGFDLYSE